MKLQKSECLENKKSFLEEIKKIFIAFEGLSFTEKQNFNQKQQKKALNLRDSMPSWNITKKFKKSQN